MYLYETSVKLHQTDAAGLLFFGDQFKMIHDCYEAFMESIGHSFVSLLAADDYLLAIVHAEADYKAKLTVGDRLKISLSVAALGKSSYTLSYILEDQSKTEVGSGKTVHVCVDKKSGASRELPSKLRERLAEQN